MATLKEMFKLKMQARTKLQAIREEDPPKLRSKKELEKIAINHRIKDANKFHRKALCKALNIPFLERRIVTLKELNGNTPPIYKASDPLPCRNIKKGSTVKFMGKNWRVV